jgi:hypothetical protein
MELEKNNKTKNFTYYNTTLPLGTFLFFGEQHIEGGRHIRTNIIIIWLLKEL